MLNDTIAAISTAYGRGGIGIVRVSGKDAVMMLSKIFRRGKISDTKKTLSNSFGPQKNVFKSHTIYYGHIVNAEEKQVDEVLVSVMLAPKTYTTEDIIEINCHGGLLASKAVLELVLANGARLAKNGEFTQRAFWNGRIDLMQAEAVNDIINSNNSLALDAAFHQLQGKLSKKINGFLNQLLNLLAYVNVSIDYPEHDELEANVQMVENKISIICTEIGNLLLKADDGRLIKEGIHTVIVGKPNVGKSSLLNVLTGGERAIVTSIPGTTRDTLCEYVNIKNICLRLIDTAGIRQTNDFIEQIGIEKTKAACNAADLVLFVLDGSEDLSVEDYEIINLIRGKQVIILVNKFDLRLKLDLEHLKTYFSGDTIIETSFKDQFSECSDGYAAKIGDMIEKMFFNGDVQAANVDLITNSRHRDALRKAKDILSSLKETINFVSEDIIALELREAYSVLGEITGVTVSDDIVDRIFMEYCLGK